MPTIKNCLISFSPENFSEENKKGTCFKVRKRSRIAAKPVAIFANKINYIIQKRIV